MRRQCFQTIARRSPANNSTTGHASALTPAPGVPCFRGTSNLRNITWRADAHNVHRGFQIRQQSSMTSSFAGSILTSNICCPTQTVQDANHKGFPSAETAVEQRAPSVSDMSVESYLSLRSKGDFFLNPIRPRTFLTVAHAAKQARLFGVVDSISEDVVRIYRTKLARNKASPAYAVAFHGLLKMAARAAAPRNGQVVQLFTVTREFFPEMLLELAVLARIGHAVLAIPSSTVDTRLVSDVADALLQAPRGATGNNVDVTDTRAVEELENLERKTTGLLFRLLQRIVDKSDKAAAFNIFKIMIEQGRIPTSALEEGDAHLPSFHTVMLSAVVRSYIAYGWNIQASQMLRDTSYPNDIDHNRCGRLVESVAVELLSMENSSATEECGKLLAFAIRAWPQVTLSNDVFSKFYESTCQLNLGEAAELLFVLSTQSITRSTLYSIIPSGQTLLWLMNQLVRKSQNQHAAQILARTVAESPTTLSTQVRPPFIQLCSRASFVSEARILWERYSVCADGDAVVGHAGTMLRLVSLFTSKAKRKGRTPRDIASNHTIGAKATLAGPDTEQSGQREHAKTGSSAIPFDRDSDTASVSRGRCFSDSKESKEDENTRFAWHVADSFRKSKDPLSQASHMDLNALARAYGMLGDVGKCLETLSLIFKRHEVPDIHDINVVVAAMAERDPFRAAMAVEEMMEAGVKPDAVTFGTVIHEALRDGNSELAGHMIKLAQSAGVKKLTPQSIASVVQAALAASVPVGHRSRIEGKERQVRGVNRKTRKRDLERVYDLIASGVYAEYLQSVKLGRTCVDAAMQADAPELAFRFWKMMMKDRVDWDSLKQRWLREQIARELRAQSKERLIKPREAEWMVRELGANQG